jgi:hypothetical protein
MTKNWIVLYCVWGGGLRMGHAYSDSLFNTFFDSKREALEAVKRQIAYRIENRLIPGYIGDPYLVRRRLARDYVVAELNIPNGSYEIEDGVKDDS